MDAESVLEIESDESDVSSEGGEESEESVKIEESSAEEEDIPDSWREVPGLYNHMITCSEREENIALQ